MTGQWVVVSGATGGMGNALCQLLVSSGYRVFGLGRSESGLSALAGNLPAGTFAWELVDFRQDDWMARVGARLAGLHPLHGLVTVAGASVGDALAQLRDEDWEAAFAINSTAPMRLSRLVLPALKEAGTGSIVHVGSPVALRGARKVSYAASKAALLGLTASMAGELGRDGIRVNLVLPGPTITPMTADWPEERRAEIAAGTHLRRLCQPEEVAKVIRFLLSDDASYVTGAIIDVTASGLFGH